MDYSLRVNLLFVFLGLGIGLMITSNFYIGLAFIIFSFIWLCLFVLPISPIKRRRWSIPSKLVVMTLENPGYKARATSEYISVWVELRPQSRIIVDRIVLKIGRKKFPSFEWKSHEVTGREHKSLDFKRPDWLHIGEYEINLIAYTPDGFSKSVKFILEVTN